MSEIPPSTSPTTFWSKLVNVWFYGTAFIGNCSCFLGIIVIFVVVSALVRLSSTVSEISEVVTVSDKEKVLFLAEDTPNKIIIIPVHGVIADTNAYDFLSSSEGAEASFVVSQLEEARADQDVKAIILDINSPGGGVVASDKIYQKVKEVNQEKPIVSLFGEVAASGGYYIAAPSSSIVANPDTLTGSIGVIWALTDMQELFAKIGLKEVVIKSGPYKDIGSSSRTMSEEEQAILQRLVDEAYTTFTSIVQEGRGLSEQQVATLADGRIYSGRQALEYKLVDALGNLDQAIAVAQQLAHIEQATVIQYESKKFWETLLEGVNQRLGFTLFEKFFIVPQQAYPENLQYLWDGGIY